MKEHITIIGAGNLTMSILEAIRRSRAKFTINVVDIDKKKSSQLKKFGVKLNTTYDDKISKSKFYQIIPDITVYNKKEAFVEVTVGVGAKRKGIADRNYLNSYNEVSFQLQPSDQSWYNIHKRLGGINISPNGDVIRISDAARYYRSNGDEVY